MCRRLTLWVLLYLQNRDHGSRRLRRRRARTEIETSRKALVGALKICRRARPSSDASSVVGVSEKNTHAEDGRPIICGEKPLPFGEEIGSIFGPERTTTLKNTITNHR